jgi:hypothetical protein
VVGWAFWVSGAQLQLVCVVSLIGSVAAAAVADVVVVVVVVVVGGGGGHGGGGGYAGSCRSCGFKVAPLLLASMPISAVASIAETVQQTLRQQCHIRWQVRFVR